MKNEIKLNVFTMDIGCILNHSIKCGSLFGNLERYEAYSNGTIAYEHWVKPNNEHLVSIVIYEE